MLNRESSGIDSNISEITPLDQTTYQQQQRQSQHQQGPPTQPFSGDGALGKATNNDDDDDEEILGNGEHTRLQRSSSTCLINKENFVQISGIHFKERKMDDTKRVLFKIGVDIIIIICASLPLLILFVTVDPYERGFFCDDESLMHPYKDSTVKNWMLYIIGFVLPIIVIIVTEISRAAVRANGDPRPIHLFNWKVPEWLVNCYKQVGFFGYGAACGQLVTDVAKYSIGRLRPHFFEICQPIMANGFNCSHPDNMYRYIQEFTCTNTETTERMLKEMRLSFPSGHASFGGFALLYCVFYLQCRMKWRGSTLLKSFLQFLLILFTWYIGLSRISDYKHHWSDVLGGFLLGFAYSYVTARFVAKFFDKQEQHKGSILPRYELSSPNHINTNGN